MSIQVELLAAPAYTKHGARLEMITSPLQPASVDAQYGYARGHLAEAMMRGFAQIGEIVDPDDPYVPWEPLFNVDICPDWALPWLAQCVGIKFPPDIVGDQARQLIKALGIQKRGTPAAIIAAGESFLIRPGGIYLRERDGGDAYRLEIVTDVDSLPETDRPLTNFTNDPRPYGGTGWSVAQPSGAVAGSVTINAPTYGVWDPPDNPPSRHSIDVTGHWNNGAANANNRVFVRTGPKAGAFAFNPAPSLDRWMTARIYYKVIKGIAKLEAGFRWWKADGTVIVSGASQNCPITAGWHYVDVQQRMPQPSDYSGNVVAGYAVQLAITGVDGQDFEISVSSAIASERNQGDVLTYGDPISNVGLWVWDGAQDNSTSHRVPTTIVQNAYQTQIPAGLVYAYRTVNAWDYQEMTAEGGTYAQQTVNYLTYQKLNEHKKG